MSPRDGGPAPTWGNVHCRDCGELLNSAENFPESARMQLILSSPLVTPSCPKGCRATASDCNANSVMVWYDDVDAAKLLAAREDRKP